MEKYLSKLLAERAEEGLLRTLTDGESLPGGVIRIGGRQYVNLSSNDYLSLSFHEDLTGPSAGAGSVASSTCSSRLMTGSTRAHRLLEEKISFLKKKGAALIFNSGYQANLGVIPALFGRGDVVFSDRLNHASIVDGIILSGAAIRRFRHNDMFHLEKLLEKERSLYRNALIITETVFSMDGDTAPLADIRKLKKNHEIYIIVDDAHGTGVFGNKGVGVEELYNLCGGMDIHMGTFGKSLGSFGAFVLSDEVVIDFLINRARTFMYTTALPPPALGAARAALKLVRESSSYKDELWSNIHYLRDGLEKVGFNLQDSFGPIVPIIVGEDKATVEMQEALLNKGLFLQAIRPPTVPSGTSRLRFTVVRGLTGDDMDRTIDALTEVGRKYGLI